MKNKNIKDLTKDKLQKFWNENSDYLKYTFGRKVIADVAKFKYDIHHWLILHGRYVCTARKPKCVNCLIHDLCEFKEKFSKRVC